MAERLTVVITPPGDGQEGLTVEDAMRQVLDFFRLVEASSDAEDTVVWRLIEAKTNSPPFSVTGEAISCYPEVDVDLIAKTQKDNFESYYRDVQQGRIPEKWQTKEIRNIAKNFFHRNLNSIAKTSINLTADRKVELTPDVALAAEAIFQEPIKKLTKRPTIFGSIEGPLVEVGTHYHRPAILIKDRITGDDIWCIVPDEFRKEIANKADFDDVWSERRVNVRGKIEYDNAGIISRVYAYQITRIHAREVRLEEIRDPSFTSGLGSSDYVSKLREGELD